MAIALQLVLLLAGSTVVFIVGSIVGSSVDFAFDLPVASIGSAVTVTQM